MAPAAETGSLFIAVRWPDRAAYRTLVIPESARSMRIRVLDEGGETEFGSAFLIRPDGGDLVSTASIELQAGTGLQVEVKAFKQASPPAGATPVAQALATGVTVHPSTETEVTLALIPANPPTITGFSPSNGGPGTSVTLTGTNFDMGAPAVRFGSSSQAPVSGVGASDLVATVPADGRTGPVSISVDGVVATSSAAFSVIKSLELTPAATSGVPVGTGVTFGLEATDTEGAAVASPSVMFAFLPVLAPGEDDDGYTATMSGLVFTPTSTGTWIVSAQSGTVQSTASVDVQ